MEPSKKPVQQGGPSLAPKQPIPQMDKAKNIDM